jgi:hypothetical protein
MTAKDTWRDMADQLAPRQLGRRGQSSRSARHGTMTCASP